MNDYILILIAGIISLIILCPFAKSYGKWKKEMNDAEAEENGAGGDKDVHNG